MNVGKEKEMKNVQEQKEMVSISKVKDAVNAYIMNMDFINLA